MRLIFKQQLEELVVITRIFIGENNLKLSSFR